MNKSKVYYIDFRADDSENILQKLDRLMRKAGIDKIDFQNRFAALKVHFGEKGNLAYLRPNYAKVVVDAVLQRGGRPFLTDCNTLYTGYRKNALEHLDTAYLNGFNPFATGCQILIADGLKGTDEVVVPIKGEVLKSAKIGRAIMDADIIISLTHFKMHECAGVGGVVKNLGMGCGSRSGKMEMHSDGKPQVNHKACIGCGSCAKNCGQNAISIKNKKATIHEEICAGCGRCIGACPVDAVEPLYDSPNDKLNKKIVEYALAVVQNRPQFHLSFVMDVSPFCDCHFSHDRAVVPDVGIFASVDPVALDLACAEIINKQPICEDSVLAPFKGSPDYFNAFHPTTNWRSMIEHGVRVGLGSDQYDLIKI
ncbi:MAG: DUF362 domain-containing protein [Planctomycetia bacterium]|nr:DUF362 domain-containing protein [Planctomycetia bacterium]